MTHHSTISRFEGIALCIFDDRDINDIHAQAHVHAFIKGQEAVFDLAGHLLEGWFPRQKAKLVRAWVLLHAADIEADWHVMLQGGMPFPVAPLTPRIEDPDEDVYQDDEEIAPDLEESKEEEIEWIVQSVEPRPDYTLLLLFENHKWRLFDARPLLSEPAYAPLKSLGFFMRAYADGVGVSFSSRVSIEPERLFDESVLCEEMTHE